MLWTTAASVALHPLDRRLAPLFVGLQSPATQGALRQKASYAHHACPLISLHDFSLRIRIMMD